MIAVGFLMASALEKVAARYPDTNFAIIDYSQADMKTKPKNVRGLLFKEQEAGYLVGYLAGLLTKDEAGAKQVIGSVGGQKIPPVDRYIAGYQAGAKKANPGITTLNAYSQDFVDQAKCKELALDQIARGAHVIFQVAGQCGLGALSAAKEKNVRGIGVDADQAFLGEHVATSALKKVDEAVFQTVQEVVDGGFSGGEDTIFDVASGAVGIGVISPTVPRTAVAEVKRVQDGDRGRHDLEHPDDRRRLVPFRRSRPGTVGSPRMDERPVLELRGITKRFPGIVANDGVDFDLRKGEVHALLGENGAGKSTLMNVLYGLYRPDEGEILINGKPAELGSPKASIENGVGMVHQHFMLIPVMTVAENIVLATEPVHNGVLLDYDAAAEARAGDLDPLRARRRPARLRPGHHRRPAAARRDPEGALPRRRHPRARRADGRADAAGGAGALRDRQEPHRPGQVDHLHQPQAERGRRDRRPDHRAAARQEDRDAARRRSDRGGPGAPDGRPRGAAPRRQGRRRPRRARCSRSRA